MSLLARLFVLVLIAVLPAVGIQAYGVVQLQAERAREVTAQAERLLTLFEGEQLRLSQGVRQLALSVAEASFVRTDEWARCQTYLMRLSSRVVDHQVITVTDTQGRALCSSVPQATGHSFADQRFLKRVMESGQFAVGERMVWPVDGRAVLPFATPFLDADGRVGGAVMVTVDLVWLSKTLAARPLSENVTLTLADRNGTVLVQVPENGTPWGAPLPEALRPLLGAEGAGAVEVSGADGVTRVIAYSPLGTGTPGLFLAVGLDRGAAMQQIDRTTRQGLAMTLLGLVIAMLAAWIGGTLFVRRPVAALTRAAEGWRDGSVQRRAALGDGRSEIGRLGAVLDQMAEVVEQREEELRGKERHLRAVLDSLPAFVAVLSPEGNILHVNRAALGGCALDAASVIGKPLDQIPCWSADRGVRARLRAALDAAAAGASSRFDTQIQLGMGSGFVLDFTLSPMLDADGRIEHLIASGTDITERKRTEEALRVAEGRFRSALTNSGVVVFNQDRELRYTWIANPAVLPAEQIIGRTDREIFDRAEDAGAVAAIKRRVLDTGAPAREEIRVRVQGQDLVFDLVVDPLRDADGAVVGVTCAALDVTGRRQAEDVVRQAREDAERANEAKSRFLAAASHDLRQPVQSLFLFAAALADRLQGHPALPLMDSLRQSLDALKSLLDGLLDISRLESGRIAAVPVPLRLDDFLARLAAEYGPRAKQKGLELRTVRSGVWVTSDPALLERILRNLIENALKYTRSGRILVGARRARGRVRVEVWDTGIGIAANQLEAIFEEFTQVKDTRSERGLGLGLAIVRRLARLLEHPVTVRSVPGKGSVFAVALPRGQGPEPVVEMRRPANDGAGKGMVLVIDDEAIILLGLKAMLEGWGYDVLAARSGEQALALLEKDGRRPQVLLSDYQLQHGRTGPEALLAIQERVGHDVPGVILTGDASSERRVEAERHGFVLLHKPVLANELRKVIAAAC